jgi:hypothetical protein
MIPLLPWEQAGRMRIGRLRVRGGTETASLRLALSAALDRAELRPSGVPPAAVLIVRRMSDPLPRRLDPQLRVGAVDAAWERAARNRLADLHRRAGRPRLGPVSDDADAVVFADEAELLACLARDIVGGRLRERWWWRSLVARLPLPGAPALATVLLERAAALPGALALLSQEDQAADVVRALTPREALSVLSAVAAVHGLSDFAASLVSTAAEMPPLPWSSRAGGESAGSARSGGAIERQDVAAVTSPSRLPRTPPWVEWVPRRSVPADLNRAQACLLGVALVLDRHPEVPRSAAFGAALRRWWRATAVAPPSRQAPQSARPGGASAARSPAAQSDETRSDQARADAISETPSLSPLPAVAQSPRAAMAPARSAESTIADRDARIGLSSEAKPATTPVARWLAIEAGARVLEQGTAPTRSAPAPPQQGTAYPAAAEPPSTPTAASASPASAAMPARPAPAPAIAPMPSAAGETSSASDFGPALEDGVETGLGGVLFLINLMCALDLPAAFEEEWRLASSLGAWGVLDALGRALLFSHPDTVNDPIWAALALLSGDRPATRPAPSANYRLPEAWLAALPEDGHAPAAWAARRGWLRVWSKAGYVLSETRLAGIAAATAAACEAERCGGAGTPPRAAFAAAPLAPLAGSLATGLDRRLKRWLALSIPFLRLRLARALGVAEGENLSRVLLARPGRLFVTRTHVDLIMGLDSVTLPVRLAGLDRSPGWLPEFGRVVLLHFE